MDITPELSNAIREWVDWKKGTPDFQKLLEAKRQREAAHCAPAQEEKEMDKCKECSDRLCLYEIDRGVCQKCINKKETRTADLRQLHRDAALAALSGISHNPDLSAFEHARYAIAAADEFVRQYNPDAVIAEVVG